MTVGSCAQGLPPAGSVHPTFVSLNPCADAILAEVADPAQILAISQFSHDPAASSMGVAAARRFGETSGSVEEIAQLRPDIVLGDDFMGPAKTGALERLGLRIARFKIETDIAFSEGQVRQVAKLAGHPERGEALVARMEAALTKAAPSPGTAPIPTVVWQSSGIVPGDGTLIADLLRRTGFSNFSAARGMRQADLLPLERMLADPPRLILTTGSAQAEADRLLRHPALAALRDTRRESLPPELRWCGGPTVIKAAQRLAEIRGRVEQAKPLPLAGGAWGGPVTHRATLDHSGPPPVPPASGRGGL